MINKILEFISQVRNSFMDYTYLLKPKRLMLEDTSGEPLRGIKTNVDVTKSAV